MSPPGWSLSEEQEMWKVPPFTAFKSSRRVGRIAVVMILSTTTDKVKRGEVGFKGGQCFQAGTYNNHE